MRTADRTELEVEEVDARPRNPKADGWIRSSLDPRESRILFNIARALNFLPIKPPASLGPTPSSSTSVQVPFLHLLVLLRPTQPLNLSQSTSNSHPHPFRILYRNLPRVLGQIGYSVMAHEHRLIRIPASSREWVSSREWEREEKLPRIRGVVATCGKSLAGSPGFQPS